MKGPVQRSWWIVLLVGVAASLLAVCELVPQQSFVVTRVTDVVDADPGDGVCEATAGVGDCTVRAAVQESNAFDGLTTVTLPPDSTSVLSKRQFVGDVPTTGDLDILSDLSIVGDGSTIDAN